MDTASIVGALLAGQQLGSTQEQRLAALRLAEEVRIDADRRSGCIGRACAACWQHHLDHCQTRPAALDCPRPALAIGHAARPAPEGRAPLPAAHPQLKAGEVHASAAVATELLQTHQSAELQVLGYTLLQHLVRGSEQGRDGGASRACMRAGAGADRALPVAAASSAAAGRSPHLGTPQVGNRWDEFSAEEHSQLATLAYNKLRQGRRPPRRMPPHRQPPPPIPASLLPRRPCLA